MEMNADYCKQVLNILLVLGSIVTVLAIVGFIQFNIWLEDTCESKFEYVCLNQCPDRVMQWFTVGKGYKNINGKIKDDQGVEWSIKLYKVKSGVYQIQGYLFERRQITQDG